MAIAWNLDAHIMGTLHTYCREWLALTLPTGGYEFLMQNCMSYSCMTVWAL